MRTVKTLKKILEKIPDSAKLYAYEGEDNGIVIYDGPDYLTSRKTWFIPANDIPDEEEIVEVEEKTAFEKMGKNK